MGINSNYLAELLGKSQRASVGKVLSTDDLLSESKGEIPWPAGPAAWPGRASLPHSWHFHGISDSRPVSKYSIWMPENKPKPFWGVLQQQVPSRDVCHLDRRKAL